MKVPRSYWQGKAYLKKQRCRKLHKAMGLSKKKGGNINEISFFQLGK